MGKMRERIRLRAWRGAWLLLAFSTDAFTLPRSQHSMKRARPKCSDSAMPLTSIGIAMPRTETRETMERPDSGQVAAIAADAPAILLVAGAGTGKTRVLAARLAHVLRRRASAAASGAAASNAQLMTLVLSFSSNAAQEICGQASVLPGGAAATDVRAVWAGTFHSFALRLLGQYPYLGTGLSRFTIADPSDQHAAMQAALAELKPTASGGASTHKLLRRLSVWKEQGLDERGVAAMLRDRWDGDTSNLGSPSRNARFAHDDREERLASAVYPVYQRSLRARGKVDFGDLLLCAVRLLQSQPAVLERLHREIGHVLVDEFQDTSPAQYELLRLLVTGFVHGEGPDDRDDDEEGGAAVAGHNEWSYGGDGANPWEDEFRDYGEMGDSAASTFSSGDGAPLGSRIFSPKHVVHLICAADDDQSIYAWRGVNAIQNMRRFTADFKGASVLQLGHTYRLQPPLLQAANSLIARNRGRVTKPPSEVGLGGPAQAFARAQLSQSSSRNADHPSLPPSPSPSSSSSSSSRHGVAELLASRDSNGNVARAPEDIQAAAASSAHVSVVNANAAADDDDCDVHGAPCASLTSVAGHAWSKQVAKQERGSSAIVVQGVYDGTAEASLVASRVESVLKSAVAVAAAEQETTSHAKAAPAVSVAILVRSAWQFQEFEEQLLLRGVPYKLEGGTSFFAKADLRFPLALMRTLVHPTDDRAFALVASHACGAGVGGATLQDLRQGAADHATTLEQAARSAVADGTIKSARILASLSLLTERIDQWRQVLASVAAAGGAPSSEDISSSKGDVNTAGFAFSNDFGGDSAKPSSSSLASALREVFDESGYMSYLEDKRVSNGRSSSKRMLGPRVGAYAVDELARAAGEFTDLEAFLRHVALQSGSASVGGSGGSGSSSSFWPSNSPNRGVQAPSSVRLMTMHRAKGREFTHVFAAGWEEGVFPLNPLALQAGSVAASEAQHHKGRERGGGGALAASMQADLDSAGSVEDERRLAYVTLTRAVGEVFLTYALRRRVGSAWYSTQASRFLSELPSEFVTVLAPQNRGAKLRATFGATTLIGPSSPAPSESLTSATAAEAPVELPFVFPRTAAAPLEDELSPMVEASQEQEQPAVPSSRNPEPWGYSTPTTTTSSHRPLQQPTSSSSSSAPAKRRRLSRATKAKIAALTVSGLKEELRVHGLKVTGPKAALIERLQNHLRSGLSITTSAMPTPIAVPPVKELQQKQRQEQPSPLQDNAGQKKGAAAPASSSTRLKLAQELPTRTVARLRLDLKAQGLKVAGNKAILVRRLLEHGNHADLVEQSLSSSSATSFSLSMPQPPSPSRPVPSTDANLKAKAVQIAKLSGLVELKASLRSRDLPVSGSKATLALRLAEAFQREAEAEDQDEQDAAERVAAVKAMAKRARSASPALDFTSSRGREEAGSPLMQAAETLAELRSQLRARGLPVGGNKATLVDRLRRAKAQRPGSMR